MSSRVLTRVLLSLLAGALCGVVVTCAALVVEGRDGVGVPVARPVSIESGPGAVSLPARAALREWDAARAAAWTVGDPVALAGLYTPGSVAGRRDVAMLRAWTERGARVTALTTQVLRLQTLVERDDRLVLVVTDRVAQVRAAGSSLPQDRPSTRRIELVRLGGTWRVSSVSPRPARS